MAKLSCSFMIGLASFLALTPQIRAETFIALDVHEVRGGGPTLKEASEDFKTKMTELDTSCRAQQGKVLVGLKKAKTDWNNSITADPSTNYVIQQEFQCVEQLANAKAL